MKFLNLKVVLCMHFALLQFSLNSFASTSESHLKRDSILSTELITITEYKDVIFAYPTVDIVCPPAYIGSCGQSSSPSQTGWPIADGNEISPDYLCYHAAYSDNNLNDCGNGIEIVRTWTITNTCGDPITQCTQVIKLSDDQSPEIQCPDDIEIPCNMYDPTEAGLPEVQDACGSAYSLSHTDSPFQVCTGSGYTILRIWNVIDECGNASSCATNIEISCRPTEQASFITFPNIGSTQLTVEWYVGNGNRRIVVMNTSNNFTLPVDGYDPTPNTVYDGSGEQVIFNDDGESVNVTGLSPNTTYWFRVFEASDCSGSNNYLTSTAVGNPKSQSTAGSSITINSITFTNVINLHPEIVPQFILYSGDPYVVNHSINICADGSTATYIKINSSNNSNINFQILDNAGNVLVDANNNISVNPSLYGKFGTPYVFGNSIEVAYTHPEQMELMNDEYRVLQFKVLNNNTPIPGIRFPLLIYRPPILFVHGLWGASSSFEHMADLMFYDNFQNSDLMFRLDYSAKKGASKSFSYNNSVISTGIDNVIRYIRTKKFSASKVDIVAHSMGGVLSRIYLQRSEGAYGYRSDINKLITIDSPFAGTQAANCLLNSLNVNLRKFIGRTKGLHCDLGAISDMRANSSSIAFLQNNSHKHHNVAIYPINSTIPFDVANFDDGNWDKTLIYLIFWYNPGKYRQIGINTPEQLADYVYFNMPGDLVVPQVSQIGGAMISNSIPFNAVHTQSKDEFSVFEFVETKLSENPNNSTNFNKNGFGILSQLPIRNTKYVPDDGSLIWNESDDSVTITLPNPNVMLSPGDSFMITAIGTAAINNMLLIASRPGEIICVSSSEINSISKMCKIPIEYVGPLMVYVMGIDENGFVYEDSLEINSIPTATLDSISVYPNQIFLGKGLTTNLDIKGHYTDGISRSLNNLSDLIFVEGDPTVIQLANSTEIHGLKEGRTQLSVSYNGKKDTCDITVYLHSEVGYASFQAYSNFSCSGASLAFQNVSNGTLDSVTWYFEGGSPSLISEENPTVTYNEAGDYDIQLIAFYPTYSDTMFVQDYIHISQLPTVSIIPGSSTSFCSGDSVILIAPLSELYSWNSGEDTPTIVAKEPGEYVLTITDSLGCSNVSDPIEITVLELPIPNITFEGDLKLCPGESVTLISEPASSYHWSTGETSPSIEITNTGSYTLTITNSAGCVGSAPPTEITVVDSAIAIITPSGNIELCSGESVELIVNESSDYHWNTGNVSQYLITSSEGTYFVNVVDSNGCHAISEPINIMVIDLPIIDLGPDTIETTSQIFLDAGLGLVEYKWSTGDFTQIISADSTGWYSVTVTDDHGCQSIDSVFLEILTSSISLNETTRVKIYPNPNNGSFTLSGEFPVSEMLQIKVINSAGQIIYSSDPLQVFGRFNKTIDLDRPSPGVYYLILNIGKNTYSGKVVIQTN